MNTFFKNLFFSIICYFSILPESYSQCLHNPPSGQLVKPCQNTIITAVPFLRITPDARSGGMGDAGIAVGNGANSMHFNASKLAFTESKFGFNLTYTPWLRALNVNDVYLGYASGFYRLDKKNTMGLSFRYFSLGDIAFTNANGMSLGTGRPNEFEVNFAYALKFNKYFSGALGLKYIYSNLAAGQQVGNEDISAGRSNAIDFSFTYKIPSLTIGLALTNLGQKITYTNSVNKDFIPTNLGIGMAWNKGFGNQNRLTLTADVNKSLVPTNDLIGDLDGDGVDDYKQKSYFNSIFGSFGDAPDGFSEELRELMFSFGAELWLNNQYVIRGGYFLEHETKGNRKYFTTGFGFRYKIATINISYLIPTTNLRNPLDNTLRFSLALDFGKKVLEEDI